MNESGERHGSKKSEWFASGIIFLLLAGIVLAVYAQVSGFGFVDYDDGLYVLENPFVRRGLTPEGISWAFSSFSASNWHPLTWLSHMFDVTLFGSDPGRHHLVNVGFHILNVEFLFLALRRMTGSAWRSALVAMLFAVHPLHVESVAWIAERKNVLSTMFWFLTILAYHRYVRNPGTGRYLAVVCSFALGLLCKPMLVTLPFTLLLLDYWPLARFDRRDLFALVREKVPLFVLSGISSVVTVLAQSGGHSVMEFGNLSLGARISNAVVSCVAYIGNTLWPSSLAVFYPHPASVGSGNAAWAVGGATLLVGALSYVSVRLRGRRPWLAVGWFWFLGTLAPVLGLVQAGAAGMADRYMYVPSIGLFLIVAWELPAVSSLRGFRRIAILGLGIASIAALSAVSMRQVGFWRNSVSLFSRAVAVTDRNWVALGNLGMAYHKQGMWSEAISAYRESLRIMPENAVTWNNLGMAYDRIGKFDQAIDAYRYSVAIRSDFLKAWYNLGFDYARTGQRELFLDALRRLREIDPARASELSAAWVP